MPKIQYVTMREVHDTQAVIVKDSRIGTWSISGIFEIFDADLCVTGSTTDSGLLTVRVQCSMTGAATGEVDIEVELACMNLVIGYSGPVIGTVILA